VDLDTHTSDVSGRQPCFGETCVIHLHAPKTGGTTLNHIFFRQYRRRGVRKIQGHRYEEHLAEITGQPDHEKQGYRAIIGHMYFGLHQQLPQQARYVTIIREPVHRVLSQFHHVRTDPRQPLHDAIARKRIDLAEFIRREMMLLVDNGLVRLISGARDVPFGQCTRTMLEVAFENIEEHFAVVGLTERFDETMLMIQRAFDWRMPLYEPRNIRRSSRPRPPEAPENIELVQDANQLDLELYETVAQRFTESVDRLGDDFEHRLKRYKKFNRRFGRLYARCEHLTYKIRSSLGVVRRP